MSKLKMGLQAPGYLIAHPQKSLSGIYQAQQTFGKRHYQPFNGIEFANLLANVKGCKGIGR